MERLERHNSSNESERDYKPAQNVAEAQERIARGWNFGDATKGKNWKLRYPNMAHWRGSLTLVGEETTWDITLGTAIHPLPNKDRKFYFNVEYKFYNAQRSKTKHHTMYEAADEAIKDWMEEHGLNYVEQLEAKWRKDTNWKERYPHLTAWVSRGKRFCLTLDINLTTGAASFKFWHYHKPTDKETILLNEKIQNVTEEQVLARIDSGIRDWLLENGDNFPIED